MAGTTWRLSAGRAARPKWIYERRAQKHLEKIMERSECDSDLERAHRPRNFSGDSHCRRGKAGHAVGRQFCGRRVYWHRPCRLRSLCHLRRGSVSSLVALEAWATNAFWLCLFHHLDRTILCRGGLARETGLGKIQTRMGGQG